MTAANATAATFRVSPEERRVQLMDLARAKNEEIEPDKLRLRKFIYVVPHGLADKVNSDVLRKLQGMAFLAHTRAGALVAYKDWLDTIQPELAGLSHEGEREFMTVQQYVDHHFKPNAAGLYIVETPLEPEEVRSPDCTVGPKRAAAEAGADDAE